MAFGSGVLLSSVAFELVEEAVRIGGQLPMALGLTLGAIVFYLGDNAIDSLGAEGIGSVEGPESPSPAWRSSWARRSTACRSRSSSA